MRIEAPKPKKTWFLMKKTCFLAITMFLFEKKKHVFGENMVFGENIVFGEKNSFC